MSVDKFGRQARQKGVGFNLTDDGDYDMAGKRIVNLGKPKELNDAVPTIVFKQDCLTLDERDRFYNAKGKTIGNVAEPLVRGYKWIRKKAVL